MSEKKIQDLKKELSIHIRDDIKNMIIKKRLPAYYKGGSCGTNKDSDDSVYINLDVSYKRQVIKTYVAFRYNENKLFYNEYFRGLDYSAKISPTMYKDNLISLARLRILRAVYEVILYIINDNLQIEPNLRSIDADVDEETGEIKYTQITNP